MIVSKKYDFPGLKKWGARGLYLALTATSWGTWILKWSFGPILMFLLEQLINWLANKGLVILNIGTIYIEGKLDETAFNNAMSEAIKKVEKAKGTLTPEQIKAIDDEVIKAARKFIPYTRPK